MGFPSYRRDIALKEVVGDGTAKFDREFKEGAVRIVRETGKPIAQVARELGVHEGTLGRWVNQDRRHREGDGALTESEREELNRLRRENAELARDSGGGVMPGAGGVAGVVSQVAQGRSVATS